jgi:hypothetical protein
VDSWERGLPPSTAHIEQQLKNGEKLFGPFFHSLLSTVAQWDEEYDYFHFGRKLA